MSANLEAMDRARVGPPDAKADDRDQVVVMREVPWSLYQTLLHARGERPRPRLAYLDGELEIMTTSRRHEIAKSVLARLLEAWVEVRGGELNCVGNAREQREPEQAGLEPDESYFVGPIVDELAPDLAIEVVQTSGGIDKLEIYRRLGVREVWFWIEQKLWLYRLVGGKYRRHARSTLFPELDLEVLARFVNTTDDSKQASSVRAYRKLVERELASSVPEHAPTRRPHKRPRIRRR
jgi:Uma2 family endonuclease